MSEPCEWLIRKGGYYYRPNRSGYTTRKIEAGRYTKAEADREASVEPWHMSAIHQDEVPDEPAVVDLSETIASLQAEVERLTLALDSATEMQNIAVAHAVETELAKLREGGEPVAWVCAADLKLVTERDGYDISVSPRIRPELGMKEPLYLRPTTEQTDACSGVREALEWAIAEIEGRTRYDSNDQFDNAMEVAKARLSALSPAAPDGQQEAAEPAVRVSRIAEVLDEGDGFWRSCSGCHELNEGHPTGDYSAAFRTYVGVGCRECGGLGVVWDTTDYADMGEFLSRPTERAVTEAWREITEDDQPPLDTDVIMGHWLTVSTRPTEWLVEVGHYGSKRGGWIHGGATHWLPLDVLPAAPALALEGK